MRIPTENSADFPSSTLPGHDALKRPMVLTVQSDQCISAVLWTLLTRNGFDVVSETSGLVDALLARSASPDVIVLDVNLPGTNGLELCRRLKADAQTSLIPIIFCSGQHYLADEALELGAAAFLSVPGEIYKLPGCLREILAVRV
jgi:DNA-binding response OmpR family regulator